jgi:hypothetical protein
MKQVRLSYLDTDGDACRIKSQEEWASAQQEDSMQHSRTLRVIAYGLSNPSGKHQPWTHHSLWWLPILAIAVGVLIAALFGALVCEFLVQPDVIGPPPIPPSSKY